MGLQTFHTEFEGLINNIVYENEESNFAVVRFILDGSPSPIVIVGPLAGLAAGERLAITGQWIENKKFGRQFEVHGYRTILPATELGITKFLGSGLIKGIGPKTAERIVSRFGVRTLDILDDSPNRLKEISGIGKKTVERISGSWREHREVREVMVFLQGNGISAGFAAKIYKRYGKAAMEIVQENPYRLAEDIFGIGFRSADLIARNMGMEMDSPERIRAGLQYCLNTKADEGHVFYPDSRLIPDTARLLEIDQELVIYTYEKVAEEGAVVVESLTEHDDNAVYLPEMHEAECGASKRLRRIAELKSVELKINVKSAIEWAEKRFDIELAPMQKEALALALTEKVLVITGGPGTGKTTLIKSVLAVMLAKKQTVLLAAPTGRAAKRMSEATGAEACTLHRLLEYQPKNGTFARHEQNTLDSDVIIVDEASMIDINLFDSLLRAVPLNARLILVGDVDQLPSVGPGQVLRDVIESEVVATERLTEIFRQAEASMIVVNAHRTNAGEMPRFDNDPDGESDFYFIDQKDPDKILDTVRSLCAERIPKKFGFDPFTEIQIMSPMQKGSLGVMNLNQLLQAVLNPPGNNEIKKGDRVYRVGDKIMQIRNNYEKEVFNGDIGTIHDIDSLDEILTVNYDGRMVRYDFNEVDELVLAYAITIHKSQGSEYPAVIIIMSDQHYVMLQRNLIYTALTRARKLAIIIGSKRALATAVHKTESRRRYTLLAERLRG